MTNELKKSLELLMNVESAPIIKRETNPQIDALLKRVQYEESREPRFTIKAQVTDHNSEYYCKKGLVVGEGLDGCYPVKFEDGAILYFRPEQLYLKEK